MTPVFFTLIELAALLRVPRSRVYEWTRAVGQDTIPAYRGGKKLLFDPEEAVAWFKRTQRREGPNRRVPDSVLGGHRRREPVGTRLPADGPAPVASRVPRRLQE